MEIHRIGPESLAPSSSGHASSRKEGARRPAGGEGYGFLARRRGDGSAPWQRASGVGQNAVGFVVLSSTSAAMAITSGKDRQELACWQRHSCCCGTPRQPRFSTERRGETMAFRQSRGQRMRVGKQHPPCGHPVMAPMMTVCFQRDARFAPVPGSQS